MFAVRASDGPPRGLPAQGATRMRSKIIAVNAGIVVVIAILTYVLLQTSLKEVVANPGERKKEVAQALRAATAQLALDALRMERWLDQVATTEACRFALRDSHSWCSTSHSVSAKHLA